MMHLSPSLIQSSEKLIDNKDTFICIEVSLSVHPAQTLMSCDILFLDGVCWLTL